ncbi:fatty acid CoA ligase family protein [Puniceicoccaceae bacterium K14]|nr:fatty acid CoA ligase family protein [Puniceicoccaceae bacterium K14]
MDQGVADSVCERVNVSRFLDSKAASQPNVSALLVPRGRTVEGKIDYMRLSFKELAEEQDAWAAKLKQKGITQGSRVLLMVKPGLPLIAICFALFKLGAVPVVIDPGMGLKSFLSCVRRSKPEHLVGIGLAIWVSRIFIRSFRGLKSRVKVGGPLECIRNTNADRVDVEAAATQSEDLAAILFTSGSTGAPKGVLYEHGMFEAQVRTIQSTFDIQPGEVDLPMLPIFALFNPALGMTTVVPEMNPSKPATVDPKNIVDAIQQCGVSNSFGSPVLWEKIGKYCERNKIKLPTMKRILMAGAPVPPSLMKRFREILEDGTVYSPYGATEVLPVSAISDMEVLQIAKSDEFLGKGTCVGFPLPGVEVRILGVDDGVLGESALSRPLPSGVIGEIVVTGPSVTKGYDKLPEATDAAKIVTKSRVWHRMGDLGYLDRKGRLWFCGRKVERVIALGETFYTDCCESVFNRHEKVFRTALIKCQNAPAIVVEPIAGAYPKSPEEDAFIEELKELGQQNSSTKKIERFFFHRSFPVDVRHNAKIHRLTLAKEFSGDS